MIIKCKKDCFLDENKDRQVFTKGKSYQAFVDSSNGKYLMTADDEGENHSISMPGSEFFDENFEQINLT